MNRPVVICYFTEIQPKYEATSLSSIKHIQITACHFHTNDKFVPFTFYAEKVKRGSINLCFMPEGKVPTLADQG